MKINPVSPKTNSSLNFKKWIEREYKEVIETDRYPDNPDYHYTEREYETYYKTEWFPEYGDYFSKDTIKEDAEKYKNMPNRKDFLKAAARARIIEGNMKANAESPRFHIFSVYRTIAKDYVNKVQAYINNPTKD